MSKRYVGGFISTSPPTAYYNSVTPGVWTLEEQIQKVYGNNWQFYPPGGFFQADVLVVAGGGGGGNSSTSSLVYLGGGGGGGGVVYVSSMQVLTQNTYSVVVGSGGAAGTTSQPGASGGQSYIYGYFYGAGTAYLSALGGGGGGPSTAASAGSGGCAGGGGANMTQSGSTYYSTSYAGGSTATQPNTNNAIKSYAPTLSDNGNIGASGWYAVATGTSATAAIAAGAGGGAGSQPLSMYVGSYLQPIQGGYGFSSSIDGNLTQYGVGGSTAGYRPVAGGLVYGNATANGTSALVNGTYFTGYGGSGGVSTNATAKAGSPGVVIIKYLQTTANITFTGATVTQVTPYTIAKFISSGSFTINSISPYVTQQF